MAVANQLVSIDIGSHKICTVIARVLTDQRIVIEAPLQINCIYPTALNNP